MVETDPTALYGVELQPVGRRVQVAPGVTVLEAVQTSGVELVRFAVGRALAAPVACGRSKASSVPRPLRKRTS